MTNISDIEEKSRFYSLTRLKIVTAFCFRFLNNARDHKSKKYGSLTVDETEEALLRCIRKTQELSYSDELKDLLAWRPVRKHSKLLALHPFLDKDGLIRVGGRLQPAILDYDQKHQMILPPKGHLSELIVQHEHIRFPHGGPKLNHSSLRQRFWIIKRKMLNSDTFQEEINKFMKTEGVRWHFISPDSPHFGGLWEAGIRSVKYHMCRVTGNACISVEEMSTILTQIEVCLNSHQLCQFPSDPKDSQALTPGHLLIGGPLMALADADYSSVPINKLSRWKFVQRCTQQLWKKMIQGLLVPAAAKS
jgi:hypothetical protein